ncbi:hypothetical protein BGL34_04315 [Fructilactobacillus lindneri]|uniref:DUF1700 domain-containing protein n=2 Tax=Fructilactobacillus lindneri TaxID=53444 RepID=A0A0R2JUL1_9LACO|nr:DUF1700 domain-containing protein [Fructilactobacillus lindneri]ANZ57660.1 hypothetical protein AYR60_02225 [Fructilactobacillus lindneri]ANZ58930.1 hypothetical protein AYR59_02225 [Fructilactobacillus lindneri]KRN78394.1 hypothetical protein IV52_GL001164 [Fructilactobacillus lindneri DSM 20690 = JCM 11027]POG97957.1 hypothetical protein BGL31_04440 [Fructilactobacillus lindneri]POG99009.1 hypothetical protein BGL32_06155 [Fructilactobacillus lindneri]
MPNDSQQYITELKYYLKNVPNKERDEATNYYTEYLEDGNLSDYKKIVNNLGTPRQLARQITANYSISQDEKETNQTVAKHKSVNQNIKLIVTILLALASPVLLTAALGLLFFIVMAIFGISILLFFSLLSAGMLITMGITTIASKGLIAFAALGLGILIIGVIVTLIPLCYFIIRFIIQGLSALLKRIFKRNQLEKSTTRSDNNG